jgi:hypothetical protein
MPAARARAVDGMGSNPRRISEISMSIASSSRAAASSHGPRSRSAGMPPMASVAAPAGTPAAGRNGGSTAVRFSARR